MENNQFPHTRRSGRYCAQPRQTPVRGEKRRLCRIQNIRLQYRTTPEIPRRHQRLPFSDFHDGCQKLVRFCQPRDVMEPFNPFLGPRCKFSWSPALEEAFQLSKEAIILAIHQGVEIFDLQKRTCLRPDWSRRGIGYFLLQQHCSCPSGIPDCCPGGWRITLAGSRFLSSAEQRYTAIEGEALAVAWGLEQTRYFTQGCDNLIVVTDHKPLVKIFGDRLPTRDFSDSNTSYTCPSNLTMLPM